MPDEALDAVAVQAATKIMNAAKAEHAARQNFEEALSEVANRAVNVRIVREEAKARRATDREMMAAAQDHRLAEREATDAYMKLLAATAETAYLRHTTPGEWAYTIGVEPTFQDAESFMFRHGKGEQDDT